MSGTMSRTPCPECTEVGSLYMTAALVAEPIGTWSLAGNQIKAPARHRPVLKCGKCTFSLTGEYDGDHHALFTPPEKTS